MKPFALSIFIHFFVCNLFGQVLLKPDRVFDGEKMHTDWVVLVEDSLITYAGPTSGMKKIKINEEVVLSGKTLMPGMIEGHSHLLLYPYNQTSWNDQVLKESESYRVARATIHARKTLLAGITTTRDLGSEGAGYADVGLKRAIDKGLIPGPRMLVAGPALVATGTYGPKGFSTEIDIHKGAEEADGDDLYEATRNQIGRGADFIKVYADYRWGPNDESLPAFTQEELEIIVKVARLSGRYVVAHANSAEAMKMAVLAGVETIEHGSGGNREVFELMKEKGVAYCPTLAAGESISEYKGWVKGKEEKPKRVKQSITAYQLALKIGVKILAGGDVGVFEHGDNVKEFLLMDDYGMSAQQVLQCITSGNADIMHLGNNLGRIQANFLADLIVVEGNPAEDLKTLKKVEKVMKNGIWYID